MFDFLDRLREKSPSERMFIAVAISASVTALITIVWMISFGVTLSRTTSPSMLESSSLDALKKQIDGTLEESQKVIESISNLGQMSSTTSATSTVATSTAATSTQGIVSPNKPQPESISPVNQATSTRVEIIGP